MQGSDRVDLSVVFIAWYFLFASDFDQNDSRKGWVMIGAYIPALLN